MSNWHFNFVKSKFIVSKTSFIPINDSIIEYYKELNRRGTSKESTCNMIFLQYEYLSSLDSSIVTHDIDILLRNILYVEKTNGSMMKIEEW